MNKLAIVYWSGTGNTETMANCIAEGAKEAGAKEVWHCATKREAAEQLRAYCRSGDTEFQDKISNKLKYQYLYEYLSIFGGSESEKLDYCASFIVAGMCALVKAWIENGMRETPEEMAQLGGQFVMHGVKMLQ